MRAVPPLVVRAQAAAAAAVLAHSCTRETGRLLHFLAAQRGRARVGEIGTGAGIGAAWLVSALGPDIPFVSVEHDGERARAAAGLFVEDPNVRVLCGDWRALMPPEAPFDLLFYRGGGKQRPDVDGEEVVALLPPGGTLVLDELAPGRLAADDPVRRFWLDHPELAAVEVTVSPRAAAVLAVKAR